MEIKLSCADFSFPLLSHDNAVDLISMIGFNGVDIGLFDGRSHLRPSIVLSNIKKNAYDLKNKLKDRGLEPADIFLQPALDFVTVAPNHPDHIVRKNMREIFLKTVEFTLESECKHMTALPGVYFKVESKEDSFNRCCEELAWRCEYANRYGLVFSVEAHLGSIVSTPKDALKLIQNTPNLTLTLDYTHFTKLGIVDSEIEPILEHTSHFHARGAAKGRLQTSVKENIIDYSRIVKVMKDINFSGYICIEYTWNEWEDCNRTDNISESILLRDLLINEWKKKE